jgi:hypothetical protein
VERPPAYWLSTIKDTLSRIMCATLRVRLSGPLLESAEEYKNVAQAMADCCEQEINTKRLQAIPWVRYCITCQEADRRRTLGSKKTERLWIPAQTPGLSVDDLPVELCRARGCGNLDGTVIDDQRLVDIHRRFPCVREGELSTTVSRVEKVVCCGESWKM